MPRVLIAYSPKKVYCDKAGNPKLEHNILSTVLDVEACLKRSGHTVTRAGLNKDPTKFINEFFRFRPDVIFNLCEEVDGDARKEKSAAAFYELLSVPFTGNGALPLALCLNKAMTKRVCRAASIPTPPFTMIENPEDTEIPFPFPAIVKPLREDGSLGITARSVVTTPARLTRQVRYIRKNFKQPSLVEAYIDGREFQVALLGNADPDILAVAELSYKGLPSSLPKIVTYAAKWTRASRYYQHTNPIVPAKVDRKLKRKLKDMSCKLFDIFDLRGYARVDFRLQDDQPYVIDVNPNPDISSDAGLAKAARHAGLSYTKLIDRVVELAMK